THAKQEQERRIDFRDPDQGVEQGESLKEFAARIAQAFEGLAQNHPGKNVMAFSHGGVIDIAWRLASGVGLDAARPAPIVNTSINCFTITEDKRWSIQAWGQTEHLASEALDDIF